MIRTRPTWAGPIVTDMIAAIVREQGLLGEIDGATGDGDHGINMAKGFRLAGERLPADGFGFDLGLRVLGDTLLGDIGGSSARAARSMPAPRPATCCCRRWPTGSPDE